MNERYPLKQLRLVTPQVAKRLGIPAEGPTFISSTLRKPEPCGRCGVIYSPLVYQTGHITSAQHYHDDGCGGIYYYTHRPGWLDDVVIREEGWIAEVKLLGQTWLCRSNDYSMGRRYGIAEAVRVIRIHARCYVRDAHHFLLIQGFGWKAHDDHELTSGILLQFPYIDTGGWFVPVCDKANVPVEYAPLQFQIRDGEVFISRRS
jgi:hypothetical protein